MSWISESDVFGTAASVGQLVNMNSFTSFTSSFFYKLPKIKLVLISIELVSKVNNSVTTSYKLMNTDSKNALSNFSLIQVI